MTRAFPLDAEQERLVADLLSYMTLAEKLGQLAVHAPVPDRAEEALQAAIASGRIGGVAGVTDRASARALQQSAVEHSRLGIPLVFAGSADRDLAGTAPLSGWAHAASWDITAIEQLGQEAAQAALNHGARWLTGPDLVLDPAGRESRGEICAGDGQLLAALGAAYVRGVGETGAGNRAGALAGLRCRSAATGIVGESDAELLPTMLAAIEEGSLASVEPLPPALARFAGIALERCRHILKQAGGADDWTEDSARTAIAEGRLDEGAIEDAVRGVLAVKSALGLFRDPYAGLAPDPAAAIPPASTPGTLSDAQRAVARNAMVLLRNRGAILPLSRDLERILVIGDPAGIAHGCREGLETFGISTRSLPGLALRDEGESYHEMSPQDPFAIALTCDAARRSDVVLVALDEPVFTRLPGRQARPCEPVQTLIRALAGTGTPIVGISACADPIDFGPAADAFSAIVLAWNAGPAAPIALAELLSGECSPSGRLPVALASETEAARFPFGHGLGYCETVYSGFTLTPGDGAVTAEIRVHNPGEFAIVETVQVYAGLAGDSQPRLACFERVKLDPGEALTLHFDLGARELGRPGVDGRTDIASGTYRIAIGKSAQRVLARELEIDDRFARAIVLGLAAAGAGLATGTFGRR